MHKYLERENEVTFDKIFNQKIGEYEIELNWDVLKGFCEVFDGICIELKLFI